jgi:hypothetical protein
MKPYSIKSIIRINYLRLSLIIALILITIYGLYHQNERTFLAGMAESVLTRLGSIDVLTPQNLDNFLNQIRKINVTIPEYIS